MATWCILTQTQYVCQAGFWGNLDQSCTANHMHPCHASTRATRAVYGGIGMRQTHYTRLHVGAGIHVCIALFYHKMTKNEQGRHGMTHLRHGVFYRVSNRLHDILVDGTVLPKLDHAVVFPAWDDVHMIVEDGLPRSGTIVLHDVDTIWV